MVPLIKWIKVITSITRNGPTFCFTFNTGKMLVRFVRCKRKVTIKTFWLMGLSYDSVMMIFKISIAKISWVKKIRSKRLFNFL